MNARESRPLGGTSQAARDLAGGSSIVSSIFALPEPDRSGFLVDVLPPVIVVDCSANGFDACRLIWAAIGERVGVIQVRLIVGNTRPLPYLRDELEQRTAMRAHLRIQVEAGNFGLAQEWCDALRGEL